MPDTRLTAEEAEQFLELKKKIDADMRDAFEETLGSDLTPEEFEEKWGASPGTVNVWCQRNKYQRFIENVYGDEDEDEDEDAE